jgi:hypothetical protein
MGGVGTTMSSGSTQVKLSETLLYRLCRTTNGTNKLTSQMPGPSVVIGVSPCAYQSVLPSSRHQEGIPVPFVFQPPGPATYCLTGNDGQNPIPTSHVPSPWQNERILQRTSTDTSAPEQSDHLHRRFMARSHHQCGRPAHLRSSVTARRWLIRINAIERHHSIITHSSRGGNITDQEQSGLMDTNSSCHTWNHPATGTPLHRDQHNDELVQRGLVRGFQVLWHRGR